MITSEELKGIVAAADALNALREKMRAECGGIGEPCVELPLSEIKAYKDNEGNWHAIIGMDQMVYFIEGLLRS